MPYMFDHEAGLNAAHALQVAAGCRAVQSVTSHPGVRIMMGYEAYSHLRIAASLTFT